MKTIHVCDVPVGGKFIYNGNTMYVVCKSKNSNATQARFEGVENPHQVFFGFESVQVED